MFLGGLDLGQAGDPSALAVLDLQPGQAGTVYQLRALVRFPLGTGYPQLVDQVHHLWDGYGLMGGDNLLAIDYTGVGRPVVDLFLRRAEIPVRPVAITSGHTPSEPQPGWHNVPKRELATVMQILLGRRRLHIAEGLADGPTLFKELQKFRIKITTDRNELFEAWREGDHDDLVLATAMPCWLGERGHLGAFDVGREDRSLGRLLDAPPGAWGAAEEGDGGEGYTTLWEAPRGGNFA